MQLSGTLCVCLLLHFSPSTAWWFLDSSENVNPDVVLPFTLEGGDKVDVSFTQDKFDDFLGYICNTRVELCQVKLDDDQAVRKFEIDYGSPSNLKTWCTIAKYIWLEDFFLDREYARLEMRRCQHDDYWSRVTERCETISRNDHGCNNGEVSVPLGGSRRLKVGNDAKICTVCKRGDACYVSPTTTLRPPVTTRKTTAKPTTRSTTTKVTPRITTTTRRTTAKVTPRSTTTTRRTTAKVTPRSTTTTRRTTAKVTPRSTTANVTPRSTTVNYLTQRSTKGIIMPATSTTQDSTTESTGPGSPGNAAAQEGVQVPIVLTVAIAGGILLLIVVIIIVGVILYRRMRPRKDHQKPADDVSTQGPHENGVYFVNHKNEMLEAEYEYLSYPTYSQQK